MFPAGAGVILPSRLAMLRWPSVSRRRGGDPADIRPEDDDFEFTPHARGSTYNLALSSSSGAVYPACAGIDRTSALSSGPPGCLPRMRGDRPGVIQQFFIPFAFTPHARGSTGYDLEDPSNYEVYPACAGIDLGKEYMHSRTHGLPRMRGDRPQQ